MLTLNLVYKGKSYEVADILTDVIFPVPSVVSESNVVAYAASCGCLSYALLSRHALPMVVHTGLRCCRHPRGCHIPVI